MGDRRDYLRRLWKKSRLFGSCRLPDGSRIRKMCKGLVPAPFLKEQYVFARGAKNGAEYGKQVMKKLSLVFTATAQYGRMFSDERNGLFTVCGAMSIGKDGKLPPIIGDPFLPCRNGSRFLRVSGFP